MRGNIQENLGLKNPAFIRNSIKVRIIIIIITTLHDTFTYCVKVSSEK